MVADRRREKGQTRKDKKKRNKKIQGEKKNN